jgi:hypothetical protein
MRRARLCVGSKSGPLRDVASVDGAKRTSLYAILDAMVHGGQSLQTKWSRALMGAAWASLPGACLVEVASMGASG